MQTPKKSSSFSDQVSWISDEKGIKIKDREYAEEMLRQIGYFPLSISILIHIAITCNCKSAKNDSKYQCQSDCKYINFL